MVDGDGYLLIVETFFPLNVPSVLLGERMLLRLQVVSSKSDNNTNNNNESKARRLFSATENRFGRQ